MEGLKVHSDRAMVMDPLPRNAKILYLIDSLGSGGAERSLVESLPIVWMGGFIPLVVCLKHQKEGFEGEVVAQGHDMRFLQSRTRAGRIREARRLIRKERPDIVHTTLFEADVIGRIASAGQDLIVLSSLVNTSYAPIRRADPGVRQHKLAIAKAIDGWTARHLTSHFHAVSYAVKQAAIEALRVDESRITVIERGRDPGKLGSDDPARREGVRNKLGVGPTDEILITVGRHEYQKGHKYLLLALGELLQDRPSLVAFVAGREGNTTEEIAQLRRTVDPEGRVSFLGHREDLPDLLAAADLFVFPSLYEGLPGALIEAMALGVPIVASDLPAIREVVEEGGNALLVPAGDPEALGKAIKTLLDDRDMARQFARRGRQIFEQRFTLEKNARRMVDLYRELLAARGG